MTVYRKDANSEGVIHLSDFIDDRHYYIPNDPDNKDWQAYQVWLSEGNQPLPPAGA